MFHSVKATWTVSIQKEKNNHRIHFQGQLWQVLSAIYRFSVTFCCDDRLYRLYRKQLFAGLNHWDRNFNWKYWWLSQWQPAMSLPQNLNFWMYTIYKDPSKRAHIFHVCTEWWPSSTSHARMGILHVARVLGIPQGSWQLITTSFIREILPKICYNIASVIFQKSYNMSLKWEWTCTI